MTCRLDIEISVRQLGMLHGYNFYKKHQTHVASIKTCATPVSIGLVALAGTTPPENINKFRVHFKRGIAHCKQFVVSMRVMSNHQSQLYSINL
jgi:hypothetical protein